MGFLKTDQNYACKYRNQSDYHVVNTHCVLFLLDQFGVVGEQTGCLKRDPTGEKLER